MLIAIRFVKNIIIFLIVIVLIQCKPDSSHDKYILASGKTMGTTYNIKFPIGEYRNYKYEIDSVLKEVNESMSTYLKASVISQFNQSDTDFVMVKNKSAPFINPKYAHFLKNYKKAREIWILSHRFFDPTVAPLVNYWGFGNDGLKEVAHVDDQLILEMLSHVGFQYLELEERMSRYILKKEKPKVELDFSSIAKGYGVDLVSELLDTRGISDYMIEVGGEVKTKGKNPEGKFWRVGISNPSEYSDMNDFFAILKLEDKAMASSGNYRNFYHVDGVKRFHSINPITGYPEKNAMRSATIIANDCMTADALATACMVMGVQKAKSMVNHIDDVSAFLIYENEMGDFQYFATAGLAFELVDQK